MLTIERLKEYLRYCPDTGKFFWIKRINSQSRAVIGGEAGWKKGGYKCISLDKKKYYCHRLAWFYIYNKWPEYEIDHINGDKSDNRIANLRDVPHSTNLQNRNSPNSNNVLGVLGVRACGNAYEARIKDRVIGYFNSPEEAAREYKKESNKVIACAA